MGILNRVSILLRAKVMGVVDRAEDPRETLAYACERQEELLADVRRSLVEVTVSKHQLAAQIQRLEHRVPQLDDQASRAWRPHARTLRRQALERRQLADCYLSARKYDLAIEQYRRTLDLFPDRRPARDSLGWAYVYIGKGAEGLREIQRSYGEDPELSPELAYVYALLGDKNKSRTILERLLNLSKESPVAPHHFALIYAGLGDTDQALLWLQQAYQQRSPMMAWLKVDPRFDNLRPDPRFQELLRRVGLL